MISEQIVKQFGGKITFESVPKEGSTFTFSFKLEQEDREEVKLNNDFRINSKELQFHWQPSIDKTLKYVGEI